MLNLPLLLGACLGVSAVISATYVSHPFKKKAPPDVFANVSQAVFYHQVYAVVVSALGLALLGNFLSPALQHLLAIDAYLFTAGTVLFSFNLYLRYIFGKRSFGRLTPTGGFLLIIAWAFLIFISLSH